MAEVAVGAGQEVLAELGYVTKEESEVLWTRSLILDARFS